MRLLQARSLRIDEAALTGESVPVDKQVDAVADAAIGDRICMGYAGTLVTQGQARAVVVATAHRDRPYRPHARSRTGSTTPLLRKMQDFGRILTLFILATGGLLFLFGTLVRGMGAGEMFMAAVGLSVAAIPEGLPAIMTITLAIGLCSVWPPQRGDPSAAGGGGAGFGDGDLLGQDRHLTRNEMTVQEVICAGQSLDVEGAGTRRPAACCCRVRRSMRQHWLLAGGGALVEAAALCNDASLHEKEQHWVLAGDPPRARC